MKTLAWMCALVAISPLAMAQRFEADGEALVYRSGEEYVRHERGRWAAGIEGQRALSWHMFLWHDEWVYETLQGGKVQDGPILDADGSVTMTGTFSAREGSAPVRYVQRTVPTAEGVRVRVELSKTQPLKLTNGVWLHIFADREAFTGKERVWAWPSWHGAIASATSGVVGKLHVEMADGRALCIAPGTYRRFDQEGAENSYTMRLNVLPGDFDPAQTAVVEYTISFADMPTEFPGEVGPMQERLEIRGVDRSARMVGLYEELELTVDLGATYDNPYDPDDVALDAVFTTPSGRELTVPGFFMVAHRREIQEGHELMLPEGEGAWKVRFAPMEAGRHEYVLELRDRTGEVTGGEGSFMAARGQAKGFVRQSEVDPHYLAHDNGDGYFAIGHNLPIYHTSGQLGDEGMRKFAAANENYNRWWMASYGFGIEWMDELGRYRQDSAARIDLVLDVAGELGLYYMMCMDTHQDFRERGWEKNPFNASNGGPCETPADWFTNEQAREYYRKRLRYTVARWGYSPHVLCWEFGNEFEGWADSPNSIKLPWHEEMSEYLASIDPFDHLISTSFWGKTGPEEFWELPGIDIVQTHCYTNDNGNVAESIREYSLRQWRRFDKPHIFGEFGIRSHSTTADKDPEGWALHNSLWSGLFSFCAGPPMPWWHERYIDKLDLYFHFTALANFAGGLPLGTAEWEMLDTEEPEYVDQNREPETRDAEIITWSRWGKPEHDEFVVPADGTIKDGRKPQELLHGEGHEDLKNPPTFIIEYPQDGEFVAHVGTVSNSGLLRIWLDDELALERDFPCAEGLGAKSVWREQWSLWETTYDEDVSVPVSAGMHRIRVENFGKDWVKVSGYTFTGCQVLDKPNLLVAGMKTDDLAILWLQNRDSSWYNHAGNGQVGKVNAFTVTLKGLRSGEYEAEWWDTWQGEVVGRDTVQVQRRRLTLSVPELETDVAVRLRRM